jgi:UrcA family protein
MRSPTFTRVTAPFVAALACAIFAGTVVGTEREVTIDIHVNARGLDISQPVGARKLYQRLKYAAHIACSNGDRVALAPAPPGCYEKALGAAVRSVNAPLLTQVYLETHTPPQAAAIGIHKDATL